MEQSSNCAVVDVFLIGRAYPLIGDIPEGEGDSPALRLRCYVMLDPVVEQPWCCCWMSLDRACKDFSPAEQASEKAVKYMDRLRPEWKRLLVYNWHGIPWLVISSERMDSRFLKS